jgi:nitrous oxidase accessory protein NosD
MSSGPKNLTRIEKNVSISYNTLAGICAKDYATITVSNNFLTENFAQGILLMETTYAHIEKNMISRNYKANIAFGGMNACDTVIINNEIKEGRQEGIFMITVGFCWIIKNKIVDNSDGIVMFDASPNISLNAI